MRTGLLIPANAAVQPTLPDARITKQRRALDLYGQFEVIQVTPAIRAGLDLHQTRSIAFYDAIIVATAQAADCEVVFTEDMNTGENLAGVRIVNTFATG